MKNSIFIPAMIAFAVGIGCTQTGSTPQADQDGTGESAADEHGHHHAAGDSTGHRVESHSHGIGPHGGTIADWGGGKYHVEFTVDHEQRQATVYVLASDERTPSPIEAESVELSITDPQIRVALQAEPQDGDPEGKSSRFVGAHEKLGVVQEYAGTITGLDDGTPYSGDFKAEPHRDHEH